jgi:hypothetical protein
LHGEIIVAVRSIKKNWIMRRRLPGPFWRQGACNTGTVKVVRAACPIVSRLALQAQGDTYPLQ